MRYRRSKKLASGEATMKGKKAERLPEALQMIGEGRWTVRRAAKFAGLTYHEIPDKMAEMGVDSGPTLKELKENLGQFRVVAKERNDSMDG